MKNFFKFFITDDRTGLKSKTALIQMISFFSILFVSLFCGLIIMLDALNYIKPLSDESLKMIQEVFKNQIQIFIVTTTGYVGDRLIKLKWGKAPLLNEQEDENDNSINKEERIEI